MRSEYFRPIAPAVILLALLALWMAIQSIPLPPSIWNTLPERAAIVEIGELAGLAESWRPITLSPQRTLNSLASLVVPITALLLLSMLSREGVRQTVNTVVWIGVASAILGMAQIALPNSEGFYFYDITNADSAVGLFSNRNHNALFLNLALLFTMYMRPSPEVNRKDRKQFGAIVIAAQALLVIGILINASRFGLLLLAAIGAIYIIRSIAALGRDRARGRSTRKHIVMMVCAGAAVIIVTGILAFANRIPAIERFLGQGLAEDQRAEVLPYVVELAQSYFPLGAGFGAFEQAYRNVEPDEFLSPRYLNHAHNDWAQVLLEGGLPVILILLAALILLARYGFAIFARRKEEGADIALPTLGMLSLAMIALHSAFDYPLRTPSIMLMAILSCALILLPAAGGGIKRLRSE